MPGSRTLSSCYSPLDGPTLGRWRCLAVLPSAAMPLRSGWRARQARAPRVAVCGRRRALCGPCGLQTTIKVCQQPQPDSGSAKFESLGPGRQRAPAGPRTSLGAGGGAAAGPGVEEE